jgi:DNA-binding NarL/FixJ family response regulator
MTAVNKPLLKDNRQFSKKVYMKVFLVDDSVITLGKLTKMISSIDGVEIAGQSTNADDAVKSIVKMKPDVAILDIHLNDSHNGIEVLEQIRNEIPSSIIIMLTNYSYPEYREKCQALGADYFFDKVTEIQKLNDTLQRLRVNFNPNQEIKKLVDQHKNPSKGGGPK